MKKLTSLMLVLLIFALLLPPAAFAQDGLANRFEFTDGTTVGYPDGWEAFRDDNDYARIANDEMDMMFLWYYPRTLAQVGLGPDDLQGVVRDTYTLFEDGDAPAVSDVQTFTANGQTVATYKYQENVEGDVYYRTFFGVKLPNGAFVTASVVPLTTEDLTDEGTILDIMTSFQVPADTVETIELSNTYVFGDESVVQYPADWAEEVDEDGYVHVYSEDTDVIFIWYFADTLADMEGNTDHLKALQDSFFPKDESLTFDAEQVEYIDRGGRGIARYVYDENNEGDIYERMLAATKLANGTVVVAGVIPLVSSELEEMGTALDIIATLRAPAARVEEITLPAFETVYTYDDGTAIGHPSDWEAYLDDNGFLRIVNDETDILFWWYGQERLEEFAIEANDLAALMEKAYNPNDTDLAYDPANLVIVNIGSRQLGYYVFTDTYEGSSYERMFALVPLEDGTVLGSSTVPLTGETLSDRETALQITASVSLPTGEVEEDRPQESTRQRQ